MRQALESGGWAPNDLMHPKIMHGAARLQPLARLGAMLATSGDPAQRRHLLAKFPCHCWDHIMQYTGLNAVCKHWQPDVGAYRGRAPALAALARAGVDGRRQTPEPSLSARLQSQCTAAHAAPPTAAVCFTGQPRTFTHLQARTSIARALRHFGADFYTFFVLSDGDAGSSYGHAALTPSSDVVTDAMHSLRPKHASFGRFDGGTSNLSHVEHLVRTCGNRDQFFKMQDGRTWRKLFEVHAKKQQCFAQVNQYEQRHSIQFDWVLWMRPDIWFFGVMPPYCQLQRDAITFPVGVVGCPFDRCVNDHMAIMPRSLADAFFNLIDGARSCRGVRAWGATWKNYHVLHLLQQAVPLAFSANPSPAIPYTLLRPVNSVAFPECLRITDVPVIKNAGFFNMTSGKLLSGVSTFLTSRVSLYERCRQKARQRFPAFRCVDAGPLPFTFSGENRTKFVFNGASARDAISGAKDCAVEDSVRVLQ